MSFAELVRNRYSVRNYRDTPVEKEKLTACIEAAGLAPSACNAQPWHFVVVDDPEIVRKIAPLTTTPGVPINGFVDQAPALAALTAERPNLTSSLGGLIKKTPFYLIDIGITAGHFCLQAAELGLGTCMLGWFNKRAVKRLLGIPAKKDLVLLITVGYPADDEIPPKERKPVSEILDFGSYKPDI